MSSGGGGQSGQTRYDWNDVIGSYWGGKPGADGQGGGGVLGWAADIAKQPWRSYGTADYGKNLDAANARVAGLDRAHNDAQNQIYSTVYGSGGYGDDTTVMGQGYVQNVLNNGDLNSYMGQKNAYGGENPYFKQMVGNANADTAKAYQEGTGAELTRLMNLSGAFGGSAHQNALANNQAGLAKQLGQQTTSMYGQQYDRSAGIESEDLGRNSGLVENALGRKMAAVPLAYQSQGLGFDRANQLMNLGNFKRDYQQKLNDAAYGNFAEGNNWERGNVNWLASLLGGAQGSTGVQTQFGGYAPTNYGSTALGLGLLGKAGGLF